MQFQKKWIVLLIGLVIIYNACKRDFSPIGPEKKPDISAYTGHNYEWVEDTLYAPTLQVMLRDIWGTSENNVWAVGHSDDIKY